jgi:uncharacterized membrane-anchored protein
MDFSALIYVIWAVYAVFFALGIVLLVLVIRLLIALIRLAYALTEYLRSKTTERRYQSLSKGMAPGPSDPGE